MSSRLLSGTLRVGAAEALMLPTGLITAIVLTRGLGPSDYGVLVLAAAMVAWVEWTVTALFSRAAIKRVAGTTSWEPVAAAVIRWHLAVGTAGGLAIAALAVPIAALVGEPRLTTVLPLFAIDVPLFCLARGQRAVLTGRGAFTRHARAGASRWTARLILICLLMYLGFGLTGAIVASIGASVVEVLFSRTRVPLTALFTAARVPGLWDAALPLFLAAMSLRVLDKLDLVMLKALGGTASDAGTYGAAQNISTIPGLAAAVLSPLLLASAAAALRDGDAAGARSAAASGLRVALLLVPMAGLAAGLAPTLVPLLFGQSFAAAAPLLGILVFGGVALVFVSVSTAILAAGGRDWLAAALTLPLPAGAAALHFVVIPNWGSVGAAIVTMSVSLAGAAASVLAVYRTWRIAPPAGTLWRSLLAGATLWAVSALGSAYPSWPAGIVTAAAILAVIAGLVRGELTRLQRQQAARWLLAFPWRGAQAG